MANWLLEKTKSYNQFEFKPSPYNQSGRYRQGTIKLDSVIRWNIYFFTDCLTIATDPLNYRYIRHVLFADKIEMSKRIFNNNAFDSHTIWVVWLRVKLSD